MEGKGGEDGARNHGKVVLDLAFGSDVGMGELPAQRETNDKGSLRSLCKYVRYVYHQSINAGW